MTTQPTTRCQQAALLFAGLTCSVLAAGTWSLEASAHPHAPGEVTAPHAHVGDSAPHHSTNPALWLAGLGGALLTISAARRLSSQA